MPYRPDVRMYRSFAASNFKPISAVNEAGSDESSFRTEGHFTTFDQWYQVLPDFYERIDRHALDGTDTSDCLFQYDHNGMVMARTKNGSLQVGIDDIGGWARADLSGCQKGRNLHEAISNGLIDEMSFGFTIAEGGFEYRMDEDGVIWSTITKIEKLFDVSAVSIPCNPNTDISARSYIDAAIEARKKADELKAEQAAEQEPEPTEQPGQPEPEQEPEPTEEEIQEALERRKARLRLRARALQLRTL